PDRPASPVLKPGGGVVFHHGGQGNGRGVRATAAQRGDVVMLIDALEAGDDDDVARFESLANSLGRDVLDAGLVMEAVSDDSDLGAGEADGGLVERLDSHGHESDGDLLAGGQEHIHLTGRGIRAYLPAQASELL